MPDKGVDELKRLTITAVREHRHRLRLTEAATRAGGVRKLAGSPPRDGRIFVESTIMNCSWREPSS